MEALRPWAWLILAILTTSSLACETETLAPNDTVTTDSSPEDLDSSTDASVDVSPILDILPEMDTSPVTDTASTDTVPADTALDDSAVEDSTPDAQAQDVSEPDTAMADLPPMDMFAEDATMQPVGPTYTGEVQAIFQASCGGAYCHGDGGKAGGHSMADNKDAANNMAYNKDCDGLTVAACCGVLMEKGIMPPGGGASEEDIATVKAWADAGAN
jgi:hypothetical protein